MIANVHIGTSNVTSRILRESVPSVRVESANSDGSLSISAGSVALSLQDGLDSALRRDAYSGGTVSIRAWDTPLLVGAVAPEGATHDVDNETLTLEGIAQDALIVARMKTVSMNDPAIAMQPIRVSVLDWGQLGWYVRPVDVLHVRTLVQRILGRAGDLVFTDMSQVEIPDDWYIGGRSYRMYLGEYVPLTTPLLPQMTAHDFIAELATLLNAAWYVTADFRFVFKSKKTLFAERALDEKLALPILRNSLQVTNQRAGYDFVKFEYADLGAPQTLPAGVIVPVAEASRSYSKFTDHTVEAGLKFRAPYTAPAIPGLPGYTRPMYIPPEQQTMNNLIFRRTLTGGQYTFEAIALSNIINTYYAEEAHLTKVVEYDVSLFDATPAQIAALVKPYCALAPVSGYEEQLYLATDVEINIADEHAHIRAIGRLT